MWLFGSSSYVPRESVIPWVVEMYIMGSFVVVSSRERALEVSARGYW